MNLTKKSNLDKRQHASSYTIPRVSIIIPTYNRAFLLKRAISSVLRQTFKNFELIVVDDGSKDHTQELINNIKDSRIRYIRHEKNKGGAAARNSGIKAANGEFIAFLDSDDEWYPMKTEKQIQLFNKRSSRLGVVGAGGIVVIHNFNGETIIKFRKPFGKFGNIYKDLIKGKAFPGRRNWPGSTSNVMIRKDCFNRIGLFDESLLAAQEHDLFIRISKYYDFDVVRNILVIRNEEAGNSISRNFYNQIYGKIRFLEKYRGDLSLINFLKGNFYYQIGRILYREKKIKEGRKFLTKAIIAYPFRFKYWLNLFFTLSPYCEHLIFDKILRWKK